MNIYCNMRHEVQSKLQPRLYYILINQNKLNNKWLQFAEDVNSCLLEIGTFCAKPVVSITQLLILPWIGVVISNRPTISTLSHLSSFDRWGSYWTSERLRMFQMPTRRNLHRLNTCLFLLMGAALGLLWLLLKQREVWNECYIYLLLVQRKGVSDININ